MKSGLAWKLLASGDGERNPDDNDLVLVNYTGWDAQGEVFQTNVGSDQIRLFDLERVFAGWREGLKLMVSGEKRRLWIPPHLGPQDPAKGTGGPVVFDVELVGFRLIPNPPRHIRQAPEEAERLPSGGYTQMVEAGKGGETPGPDSQVLLNYIGWNQRGRRFDSTIHRGRPTAFLLDLVVPQFSEAVQRMTVGEKRYIWMPAGVASGQWPEAPKKGTVTFQVELLRILPANALKIEEKGEGAENSSGTEEATDSSGEAAATPATSESAGEAESTGESAESTGEGETEGGLGQPKG